MSDDIIEQLRRRLAALESDVRQIQAIGPGYQAAMEVFAAALIKTHTNSAALRESVDAEHEETMALLLGQDSSEAEMTAYRSCFSAVYLRTFGAPPPDEPSSV